MQMHVTGCAVASPYRHCHSDADVNIVVKCTCIATYAGTHLSAEQAPCRRHVWPVRLAGICRQRPVQRRKQLQEALGVWKLVQPICSCNGAQQEEARQVSGGSGSGGGGGNGGGLVCAPRRTCVTASAMRSLDLKGHGCCGAAKAPVGRLAKRERGWGSRVVCREAIYNVGSALLRSLALVRLLRSAC